MELQIYNNDSNTNVVNKKITLVDTVNFNLKSDNSILQPILLIKKYTKGNYCYIKEFNRYYYITDIKLLTGGLYQLQLEIDVLMSYKEVIMTQPITTSKDVKIANDVDFTNLYDYEQYFLIIGG